MDSSANPLSSAANPRRKVWKSESFRRRPCESPHRGLDPKNQKISWGFWLSKDISNSQINVIHCDICEFVNFRVTAVWHEPVQIFLTGFVRQDRPTVVQCFDGQALMVAIGCCCYLLLFPKSIIFQVARDIKGSWKIKGSKEFKRCWFHAGNPDAGQPVSSIAPRFSQVTRTPLGPTIGYPSWSSSGFVWKWGTPK